MSRVLTSHRAARTRSVWAARPNGTERLARGGAPPPRGRADPPYGPEPRALGPTPDPTGDGGAWAERPGANWAGAGGAYALRAAIIACHAQARTAGDTDWSRISRTLCRNWWPVDTLTRHRTQPRSRPLALPKDRQRRWRSWTALCVSRCFKAITCCRAFEAISSTSSAATKCAC